MTKISYIHGPVPANEFADRAKEVQPAEFFNPLVLTEGGAYLRLMRDQVKVLSEYYPENRTYRKGLSLIDNALYSGIHGTTPYIGALEPSLYPVARAIDVFKAQRQPATRPVWDAAQLSGSWRDESMIAGEIPDVPAEFALWWIQQDTQWLTKFFNGKRPSVNSLNNAIQAMKDKAPVGPEFIARYKEFAAKYDTIKYIVTLYNDTLEKFAHHPLYNFLPQRNEYPASVVTKNILHTAGVQACANTGEFSVANMSLWTRNSILRANIGANVGALSPERTAFALTGLPDGDFAQFIGQKPATSKGSKIQAYIGIAPAVAAGIIALIGTAVVEASKMYQAAQARKAAAFSGVQGWGTSAYAASEADWKGMQQLPPGTAPAGSGTNWPVIVGAGALGAWLLTSK